MTMRDVILSYQKKAPFSPFTVHLADARSFVVNHPDALFNSRLGILYHESDDGELTIFDTDLVTSVTVKRRATHKRAA
jgi:hypothetical protein